MFFFTKEHSWQSPQQTAEKPIFLKFVPIPLLEKAKKDKTEIKKNIPSKFEEALNTSEEMPPLSANNIQDLKNEISSEKFLKIQPPSYKNNNLNAENFEKKSLIESLPMSGKLSVLVYYGNYSLDASPIGQGFLEVVYPDKNVYEIKLSAKVVGWASVFFRKPLIFQSIGTVDKKGLTPKIYKENTPRRGESYVRVEHLNNTLYFSSTNKFIKYRNEELHDPLSLIFHLAWLSQKKIKIEFNKLSPFHVFDRKKLREIKLIADLPEEIVLPGGVFVEAIKIKSKIIESKRPGTMTFWLDPSDNFLPVRISYENEKTKKTIDFLILREEQSSLFSEEKNNINQNKKINSHPYLPNY